MEEIKKIVLATDFSSTAKEATQYAKKLKEKLGASLTILHVFDEKVLEMPSPYYFIPDAASWMDNFVAENKKRGQQALEDLWKEVGEDCEKCFLEGTPGKKIVEYTEKNEVDLIIMGTHGFTGLTRLFMGSVAEYVMRHVNCPVLTIRREEEKK